MLEVWSGVRELRWRIGADDPGQALRTIDQLSFSLRRTHGAPHFVEEVIDDEGCPFDRYTQVPAILEVTAANGAIEGKTELILAAAAPDPSTWLWFESGSTSTELGSDLATALRLELATLFHAQTVTIGDVRSTFVLPGKSHSDGFSLALSLVVDSRPDSITFGASWSPPAAWGSDEQ